MKKIISPGLVFFLLFISCKNPVANQPVITSIYISQYAGELEVVYRGDKGIEFTCESYDNDGFIADYVWEATGGEIQGAAHHARWDAPLEVPGTYYVICTVKDNDNNIARASFEVYVHNNVPSISLMTVHQTQPLHQPYFQVGNTGGFVIVGGDRDYMDQMFYKFEFPDGISSGWQASNIFDWTAPAGLPYRNLVFGYVKDNWGDEDVDSLEIFITN